MGVRRGGSARQGPAAVALIVLGLLMAALAARSSPSHPFHATSRTPSRVPPSSVRHLPGASRAPHRLTAAPTSGRSPSWALVVLGVAVLVGLVLLARRRLPRKRVHIDPTPGLGLVAPPPTPAQVAAAIDQGVAPLDDRGPVADAIIASWVAVGESLRRAGLETRHAETSSEYVERVLVDYGVDEAALRELSALYREARFSTHPLGEPDRAAARRCVVAIRGQLAGAQHA